MTSPSITAQAFFVNALAQSSDTVEFRTLALALASGLVQGRDHVSVVPMGR
jgi:hypothetical protein